MKKLIIILLVLFSIDSFGQETKFFEGNWAETLNKAKKENKLIFVDVSTTWCRPCKKMKKEILPQKKVGYFFNSNFINLSINAHNWEGLEFNLFYKVNSYPTFIFLDKNGNIIQKAFGFKTADQLIKVGKRALELYDKTDIYKKEYKAGKRNYAFIIKYINALNKIDSPSEFLIEEFLKSNNIREDIRLKFIFRTINTTEGKAFDELINNIDKVKTFYKPDEANAKIYSVFIKDINKAALSGNKKQIKRILKLVKKTDFIDYKEIKQYSKLLKAEKDKNLEKYKTYARKYFDLIKNDIKKINFIKSLYLKQINRKDLKNLAFDLAKELYKDSRSTNNQVLLIKLAVLTKHFDLAKTELKHAYHSIDENPSNTLRIKLRNYYNYINKKK